MTMNLEMFDECRLFPNGHRPIYNETKSTKEESVFECLCGHILGEYEDSNAGC